jgi:ABC-2 type transport system ATP-binding protein
MTPLLCVRSLEKSYKGRPALRGVNLDIREGEIFGLLGPNGAGKSTLMHILSGLIGKDGGEVRFGGEDIRAAGRRGDFLGLVPQQIALYLELTAWANIDIFGRLHGLRGAELRERGEELLRLVNLLDRRHERVKTFSGGMQRRLNLAVSLLHRPRCLLCDEPTVGVDPQSRNAIFEFLEAQNRAGLTIIYTTHYMEEVERLCHRIGIIDGGRLLAEGTREALLTEAAIPGTVRLHPCPQRDALAEALRPHGQLRADNGYVLFEPTESFALADLAQAMERTGFPQSHLEIRRPSLEHLFLHLTGKELRE